jgi:hypothetical protein
MRVATFIRAAAALGALGAIGATSARAQTYSEVAQGPGVKVEHPGSGARFVIRIENVSTPSTLKLSNGSTAPAPNAPGLWVVFTDGDPVFTPGKPDRGDGLESLAEDGSPLKLAEAIGKVRGVVSSGTFTVPVGDREAGAALPGKAFEFTITAEPGQKLAIASMFGQSNDLFFAPVNGGIPLFSGGKPIEGDITSKLALWDVGTEVNQEPGLGPDQAPRQATPNTGKAEREPVQLVSWVKDGFRYPKTSDVIRVTVRAQSLAMGDK